MNTEEIDHHIKEAKELLEKGRFILQEVTEKMNFITGDLWIVMKRLNSIAEELKTK